MCPPHLVGPFFASNCVMVTKDDRLRWITTHLELALLHLKNLEADLDIPCAQARTAHNAHHEIFNIMLDLAMAFERETHTGAYRKLTEL